MKRSSCLSWLVALVLLVFAAPVSAQTKSEVWVEGSYEYLALPPVKFVGNYFFISGVSAKATDEFRNADGDFHGNRIDGGVSNIPIMGGPYKVGVKGFFSWQGQSSTLACSHPSLPAEWCLFTALVDDPNTFEFVANSDMTENLFTTHRDVNHWGVAIEAVRGPMGLKAGPAFRQIGQDLVITGRGDNSNPYRLTYREDLATNYLGAFIGVGGRIDMVRGWSVSADAEAGLYWADTDYDGHYSVTNAIEGGPISPNIDQRLSLNSDELAFIGIFKATLEKDFGWFKLAGIGRFEYISSAPEVHYNNIDTHNTQAFFMSGPNDGTHLDQHSAAYAFSAGVRLTVPFGSAK